MRTSYSTAPVGVSAGEPGPQTRRSVLVDSIPGTPKDVVCESMLQPAPPSTLPPCQPDPATFTLAASGVVHCRYIHGS